VNVAFADPANARVLAYFKRTFDARHPENRSAPPSVYDLMKNPLGTHPDLAARLWNELTIDLPEPCAWVVYARPVLVHPARGIIFGFAWGTHTYALKLDEPEFSAAVQLGARRLQLGSPWTLGEWRKEEVAWCLAAYHAAARTSSPPGP
jgi:hypothetical protein